jgi:hypothetical protein
MTLPPHTDQFCPICGGVLRPVGDSLYCQPCDLYYEADNMDRQGRTTLSEEADENANDRHG